MAASTTFTLSETRVALRNIRCKTVKIWMRRGLTAFYFPKLLFDAGLLQGWPLLKDVLRFRLLIVGLGVFELLDENCSSVWMIQLTLGE